MAVSELRTDGKTWTWDGSSRIPKKYAVPFGHALERVRERVGDTCTAKDVVEEARPKQSPIHSMFEWDDKVAGERWREEQARGYLRALIVVMPTNEGDRPVPAVISTGRGEGYTASDVVLTSDTMRRSLLKRALSEAQSWRRRYDGIKELAGVYAALDALPMFEEPEAVHGTAHRG
jgi:hypothetical protein